MGYHRTGALFAIGWSECETSEYGFRDSRLPVLRFPRTGISNTLAEAARDSLIEELEEILAGAWAERNVFLAHGDGGTEEDEEGGSQKGEAQE